MYSIEFETDIKGDTLMIPAYAKAKTGLHKHVSKRRMGRGAPVYSEYVDKLHRAETHHSPAMMGVKYHIDYVLVPALCAARPGYALRAASLHLSQAAGCETAWSAGIRKSGAPEITPLATLWH
ncbi:MAG: hypothetical protein GY862_25505 [Gammaproteobacteria bacterium]|nr:hypothetical protein [Gammaproteobacteria bacterium]